jgi:[acyl-carrier-protein] S-malonyltransferase
MEFNPKQTAILFPGQGVGDESSRRMVAGARPDLLDLATAQLGTDPYEAISEGTRYAQPAVYCASIAGYQLLGRPRGDFFAGHSLGEVGALAAGGAITDEEGLRIVVARGRAMAEAASAQPAGGMLGVGGDRGQAEALAEVHGLALANENSPRQFVLSGPLPAIESAEHVAKAGELRAKRLAVAGAFHTAAMAPAVAPFRAALEEIDFEPPRTPVLSSTTADVFGADPREQLVASLTGSIRWIETLRRLSELGARRYLDVGPGKVLAGLVRRTLDDAEVEKVAAREAAVA